LLLTIRRCTPACAAVSDQNGTSRVDQFSAVVTEATDHFVNQLANDFPVAAVFAACAIFVDKSQCVCLISGPHVLEHGDDVQPAQRLEVAE